MSNESPPTDWVPVAEQGTYSDGHPRDHVQYLECKIILKAERFASQQDFFEFGKIVQRVAGESGVDLSTEHLKEQRPQIREVVFLDTTDFRLYSNAFILRRRTLYEDGFPSGEPEIVFKFRHPDMNKAAALDVRPQIPGVYRTKFKAEMLPLKDQLGGTRVLYSHNAMLSYGQMAEATRTSLSQLAQIFPCLQANCGAGADAIELVNQMFVEEVQLDLGKLDFGKGVISKTDAALWRTRGDHKPLAGEFSFQIKFERSDEVGDKVKHRCDAFFVSLQKAAADWVSLGTTKTGIVYGIGGRSLRSSE